MGAEDRSLECEKDLLTRASGSVRFKQGGTKILAAVHGPQPALQRKAQADRAVVEVVLRPRFGLPGNVERLHETIIRQTVEAAAILSPLPQSSISIVLQVVSSDGCSLACEINAACAVLMDAGIPLHHPFAAVACAVSGEDQVFVHPDAAMEQAADATLTAAFGSQLPASGGAEAPLGLMVSQLDGKAGPMQYLAAVEACAGAVPAVLDLHRKAVQSTFKMQ